ncbi:MAG: NF038122 family metalloprotease, partial [Synechococcales bacterium]|nr:NF038122 family metalloprotease [Synechococcales bacterium]
MRRNLFDMANHNNALPALSVLIITTMGVATASTPAAAIEFNFGFSEGTPQDVINGFNAAASAWSSVLKDDVTINLDIRYEPYTSSSLGQFSPTRVNVAYRDLVSALTADITSVDDATAIANLPKSSDFDLMINPEFDLLLNGTQNNPNGEGSLVPFADTDGDCNNRSIRLTSANVKALGLPMGGTNNCAPASFNTATNLDGSILLNSTFAWDFDRTNGIEADAYDFVGIVTQGLGVTLGFVSGVDVLDFNSPLESGSRPVFFNDDQFPFVSPVDLFRFSQESVALAESEGLLTLIDWTTGRRDASGQDIDKYFSIDGGTTKIASFSTGIRHGDGYRASSWKADELGGSYIGIMEPSPSL